MVWVDEKALFVELNGFLRVGGDEGLRLKILFILFLEHFLELCNIWYRLVLHLPHQIK